MHKLILEEFIKKNGMKLAPGVTIEEDAGIPYLMVKGKMFLGTRAYRSMYFRMLRKGWIVVF